MKVNSEHLYEYINDLATDEKVKFKVYYDDSYVTEIYWNGKSFEWDTGTFTSEAFFNPMYDFEVIEENKKIKKIDRTKPFSTFDVADKVDEIVDIINEMREDK